MDGWIDLFIIIDNFNKIKYYLLNNSRTAKMNYPT